MNLSAYWLQLYNESIVDLLTDDRCSSEPRVHEDVNGGIFVQGVASYTVMNPHEVSLCSHWFLVLAFFACFFFLSNFIQNYGSNF